MLYIQSEVIYTSRSSYNLCWLDEQGRVTTHNQLLYPEVQVLQRKSIAQMIQGLPVRCYLVPQKGYKRSAFLIFPPHPRKSRKTTQWQCHWGGFLQRFKWLF